MTLNLAWISGNGVFLVSDTSRTNRGKALSPTTSLGQTQQRTDGVVVEELAAKLVPLGTHAAAALCGDARATIMFVRSVQDRMGRNVPLVEAMRLAGHSLGLEDPPFGHFLVTVAQWDHGPKILRYDSSSSEVVDVSEKSVVVEGSLRAAMKDRVRESISGLPGPEIHGQVLLVAALSLLQGLGASEDLVSACVAGVFYGLHIDAAGLHWQPNVLYVFYSNDGPSLDEPPMNLVGCRVLDGVCTIGSSLNQEVRCLVHPGNDADRAGWMERWRASLSTQAALIESRLIAFVRVTGSSVLLINNDGRHFTHEYQEGLALGFSPQLEARLRWKPTDAQPFNFSLGLPPSD